MHLAKRHVFLSIVKLNEDKLFIFVFYFNMEALDRIFVSNDWTTLLILGIAFLVVLSNFIDHKRLQQLFSMHIDASYRLNFTPRIWHIFNVFFFAAANLIVALFIYRVLLHFYPDTIAFASKPYFRIVVLLLVYWTFRYGMGKLIAYLFEIEKMNIQIAFLKMSYFFSSSLYLLLFLVFEIYFFDDQTKFIYVVLGFYAFLLLIRYFHFITLYKSQILFQFFYFILYLCALEIAPLLLAVKIGI